MSGSSASSAVVVINPLSGRGRDAGQIHADAPLARSVLRAHGIEKTFFQHPRFYGALVTVVLVDVPAAEDEIIQFGKRNKVMNFGDTALGALS